MRLWACSLVLFACGTPASRPTLALGDAADAPGDMSDAMPTPPLHAALVWASETQMSPNGPLDRVTLVDATGAGFPMQLSLAQPPPPPADVLADATTYQM